MDPQKQKNIPKNFIAKLRPRRPSNRALRMAEPLAFVVILLALAAILQLAGAKKPAHTVPQTVAHKKITTHKRPVNPQPAPQTSTASSAASATPSAPTPAPAAKKPAPTAGSSKAEPVVTPSPSSSVSGLTPTAPAPSGPQPGSAQVTTGYTSSNWSGYMATSGTFTAVSGSWHATNATGNGTTTSADSTWIGIGGVTSGDLIQVGTQNIISANGQVVTSAFYEMLPAYAQTIPGVTVAPGDSMSASITEVGSSLWAITIADNTDGQSFSITVSYASSLSSAEWIEEDPSYSAHQQIPFDNFQAAYFTGATTTQNGIAANLATSTAQPVIMVNNNGQAIAVPSVINSGNSFSVTP
ncbi:MAG TPA: G1 family glutamic endopeptidase [Candidatus Saccharimonadales bacterium]|nr:G1 family glutamic endopeptidase [Candidatus Saccharimonadales bacterium]